MEAQEQQLPEVPQVRVSVLILSYNRAAQLRRCLAALHQSNGLSSIEIIVLDNGSQDGSATLDSEFPEAKFQRMARNFGATKGLTIGARTATSSLLLFLDPEVEVQPDTVMALVDAFESTPEAGGVVPLLIGPDGKPANKIYRLPGKAELSQACRTGALPPAPFPPLDAGPVPLEYPGRSALLIRKQFLQAMNYFDERYGHAWADLELAFQIRHAGKKILLLPSAKATLQPYEPHWNTDQRATLAADSYLGASGYLSKRYGFTTGLAFQFGAIFSALGKMLTFQDFGFHFKLLLGLLAQQKIDGSQGGI